MHQPLRHPRAPTLFPYPALPVTLLPRPLPKSRHPGIAPNGSTWSIPRTSADLTTHTPARSHLPAHAYDTDLIHPHLRAPPLGAFTVLKNAHTFAGARPLAAHDDTLHPRRLESSNTHTFVRARHTSYSPRHTDTPIRINQRGRSPSRRLPTRMPYTVAVAQHSSLLARCLLTAHPLTTRTPA